MDEMDEIEIIKTEGFRDCPFCHKKVVTAVIKTGSNHEFVHSCEKGVYIAITKSSYEDIKNQWNGEK